MNFRPDIFGAGRKQRQVDPHPAQLLAIDQTDSEGRAHIYNRQGRRRRDYRGPLPQGIAEIRSNTRRTAE